jgi:hypothetical protein
MDCEKLASQIVDVFCSSGVATGSDVTSEEVRLLLEEQDSIRHESFLTVKGLIENAMEE